jgi:hypothetical protein
MRSNKEDNDRKRGRVKVETKGNRREEGITTWNRETCRRILGSCTFSERHVEGYLILVLLARDMSKDTRFLNFQRETCRMILGSCTFSVVFLRNERVSSSEMLVLFHETTRCGISEGGKLHSHSCKNAVILT